MYHELFLERAVPSKLTEAVVPMTCTREVLSSKLDTETIITEDFGDSSSAFSNRYLGNSSIHAVCQTHSHWFLTEPHKPIYTSCSRFQASVAVAVRSSFFWDITQPGSWLPTFRDNLSIPSLEDGWDR
jgi:hypothetical protein